MFIRKFIFLTIFCAVSLTSASAQTLKNSDPKAAVQTFFTLLKGQKYAALYDFLPGEIQQKTSREQMTNSLKRLSSFISIQKMDIGRVQQKGDFAVVDTTIIGKLIKPINKAPAANPGEGKFAVQQYLFKENGSWKVATSDSVSQKYFLKKYPNFKEGFQLSSPRLFIKQDGQWKAMN